MTTTQDRFAQIVSSYTLTCHSAPTQYEGQLHDGRWFYFRYRFARAQLGIADTLNAAVEATVTGPAAVGVQYGDGMAGHVDRQEFKELFVRLYDQPAPAAPAHDVLVAEAIARTLQDWWTRTARVCEHNQVISFRDAADAIIAGASDFGSADLVAAERGRMIAAAVEQLDYLHGQICALENIRPGIGQSIRATHTKLAEILGWSAQPDTAKG